MGTHRPYSAFLSVSMMVFKHIHKCFGLLPSKLKSNPSTQIWAEPSVSLPTTRRLEMLCRDFRSLLMERVASLLDHVLWEQEASPQVRRTLQQTVGLEPCEGNRPPTNSQHHPALRVSHPGSVQMTEASWDLARAPGHTTRDSSPTETEYRQCLDLSRYRWGNLSHSNRSLIHLNPTAASLCHSSLSLHRDNRRDCLVNLASVGCRAEKA